MSNLADELSRLCCAETEKGFFDLVTDRIETIIADIRRLDFLEKNTNYELLCTGGWGDEEMSWNVYRVNGGRNDREWTLIGRGATPREAIDAAMRENVT